MSYCTVDQVAAEFPRFVRNASGSVQDSTIQIWIDNAAGRIDAALIQRGIAPGSITLSTDQTNWLRSLNLDAAVGRLGLVLQAQTTLQAGEVSLPAQRLKQYESILADIRAGRYDWFFGLASRLAGSIAGAETDQSTPEDRDENRAFGLNDEW